MDLSKTVNVIYQDLLVFEKEPYEWHNILYEQAFLSNYKFDSKEK